MRNLNVAALVLNALASIVLGAMLISDAPGRLVELGLVDDPGARGAFYGFGAYSTALAAFSLLAAYWIAAGHRPGRALAILIGFVLVAVAAGVFVLAGTRLTLLVDGLRGFVVMALAIAWRTPLPAVRAGEHAAR